MIENELQVLCQIAEQAGREIMSVYQNASEIYKKDDNSPLTEADLKADCFIRQRLEHEFPSLFILSEESISLLNHDNKRFFLVDPLDGTKEFLKCNGEFTVNIALIENGMPLAGVIFAPALDELFYAARGLGAWKKDIMGTRAINTKKFKHNEPLRIISSRSHGNDKLKSVLAKLNHKFTVINTGSSLKFCRIAEGKADIYPRFAPTSQWDTAAAQVLLEEAGGGVVDIYGTSLCYGLNRPLLNLDFIAFGDEEHWQIFESIIV